jgi:hypothetical protein
MEDAFEDTASKMHLNLSNCIPEIRVAEPQLFTFFGKRSHQWLSDIDLKRIKAFFSFLL